MPQYEIYALKYAGPFTRTGAHLMWYQDWDKIETVNYYIWCIKGADATVVVDAGVTPRKAAERELEGYVNPVDVLARINVSADEVRHVVISHMHFDHAGGVSLFPRATFCIQQNEYRFWRRDPIADRAPFKLVADAAANEYLAALEGTRRLVLLDGDQQILPGIECLLSPGHTVALQTVAVQTSQGTAIVGSDCAHVFRNYREDWPSALIVDLVGWSIGVLEYWSAGVLGYWSAGVLEYWSAGVLGYKKNAASGQKTVSLIEKETFKKRISNIEQGITNAEGMYSIYFKMTERSDSTLHHSKFLVRYSAVRCSIHV